MALLTVLVTVVLAASPALSSQLGEPCQDDFDCAHDQQECIKRFDECEKKVCLCKPDYGGRFHYRCTRMLGASERCQQRASWVGCPPDTDCDSTKDMCVPRIKAGSACTTTPGSIPCTTAAHCNGTLCVCDSYSKTVDGRCGHFPFGEACVVGESACDSNYQCMGTPPTCQCLNTNYTKQTLKQDGSEGTGCIHVDAKTDVALGGACLIGDLENTGKICKSGLTCSRCLFEDAPTCITPGGGADGVTDDVTDGVTDGGAGGGADGVKAGFFILSAALLLTTMM